MLSRRVGIPRGRIRPRRFVEYMIMRKAEESLMKERLVAAVWIPNDGKNIPYSSESTL